jgi:hypothetical protein
VLGKQLYDAIQRLWELEKTDACLPTAQGSILIGLLCCTFGIDRIGTRYILHGAELAQQFGLDRDGAGYFATENTNLVDPIHRCQTIVAWAFFDIQAYVRPLPHLYAHAHQLDSPLKFIGKGQCGSNHHPFDSPEARRTF